MEFGSQVEVLVGVTPPLWVAESHCASEVVSPNALATSLALLDTMLSPPPRAAQRRR